MDWATLAQWLGKIDTLTVSLGAVGVLVIILLLSWLVRRVRKPAIASLTADGPRGLCARLWAWIERLLDAIDYLATRREWRYRQPWVLVLGEKGSGKTSVIDSVAATWRFRAPQHASELKGEGLRWAYFRQGALIDCEGTLSAADEGSEEAAQWLKTLASLNELRPERALDGVMLCVSARTLCNAKLAQRTALAENVNRQLSQLQSSIEFMLPAYVVVTQCDAIPGFSAFWQSQGRAQREDLVGYSATGQDQSLLPTAWANAAFDLMGERLRELQVDVAAHSEQVGDVDNFFLFPGHFLGLRVPLSQWLETVFRTSAWQSGYLFRGMYFTGSVEADGSNHEGARGDVDFVDGLMSAKVLSEPALAKPTRQGVWSRNRLIRGLQVVGIVASFGLFLALGLAAHRFSKQVDAITVGVASLKDAALSRVAVGEGACLGRDDVYPLLEDISRIDTNSRYWAIPWSWVDGRLTSRTAQVIGKSTVNEVLIPTLACRLNARAAQLQDAIPVQDGFISQRDDFQRFVADVRALEDNRARANTLVRDDSLDEYAFFQMLDALAEYAFGVPLPADARRPDSVLDNAFSKFRESKGEIDLVDNKQMLEQRIDRRSKDLRTALTREVAKGGVLLNALRGGQEPVLDNTRDIALWLVWVQQSWLGSTVERNPCRAVIDANQAGIAALIKQYRYGLSLDATLQPFDTRQCFAKVTETLQGMRIAPYGPVFVVGKQGLELTEGVHSELVGIPALGSLHFMQLKSLNDFACAAGDANWRANEIAEAAGYLNEYDAFVRAQQLPPLPAGGRPLYDVLARQSLVKALDDTLRRAQQAPPAASPPQDRLEAISRTEQRVGYVSGELSNSLASLQAVLSAYGTYGFADGGARVRQCARYFASDNLGSVDSLVDSSQLYVPPAAVGTDAMFALGSLPVTKDYLARQLARAQVLAGYATPFVSVLGDSPEVDDARLANAQTAAYWRNTLSEINSYVQGKNPTGQVANLESYFVAQLSALSYPNCAEVLAAYKAPDYGNDLFSERRRVLERQVQLRCSNQREAQAAETYGALASRFNRDLAGRYPFADLAARDASPSVVRAFFVDYAKQHDSIAAALVDLDANHWQSATRFIEELDSVAAFFATNVDAPAQMGEIALAAGIPATTGKSVGAEQLLAWRLTVGQSQSVFPNGLSTLAWLPGQPMSLELEWADRSEWRPLADPAQPNLTVQGVSANFAASGPWALLRFVQAQRVRAAGSPDPSQLLLRFNVPVQGNKADAKGKPASGTTRLFVTLAMSGVDAQTQASKPLVLPDSFPSSAPTD